MFLPSEIEFKKNKSAWYFSMPCQNLFGDWELEGSSILRIKFIKPALDQLSIILQRKSPIFKTRPGNSGLTIGNLPLFLSLPDDNV